MSATFSPNTNCIVSVNYCLNCAPTGHPIMKLCSVTIDFESSCDSVEIDGSFWDQARIAMLKEGASVCGAIGPCPQRQSVDIYQAQCWKLEPDWEEEMVYIVPCDEEPGECFRPYELCYENGELVITAGTPSVTDEGECGTESIIIAPPPYDIFLDCFNSCY